MAEGGNEGEDKQETGIYDHPIYKEISLSNGMINRMEKDDIKKALAKLHLDSRIIEAETGRRRGQRSIVQVDKEPRSKKKTSGVKEVLQRRLKNHIKKEKLTKAKVTKQKKGQSDSIDYYVVIDFEATCEQENPEDYKHEIIEFPAVLVNASTLEIEKEFQEYCKPLLKPNLSTFCQELTGITQEMVDKASNFPQVLDNFYLWLKEHELGTTYKFAVATDGPWDIQRFLTIQCQICNITLPNWSTKWINIRKHYRNFYKMRSKLNDMLENLGMEFEGRPHSGLDDSRNIARIMIKMIKDGCELTLNEKLKIENS